MPDINQLLDDVARYQRQIRELEQQLAKALMGTAPEVVEVDGSMIRLEGIVSSRTGAPKVTIRWGLQLAQLSPAEARERALAVLECADAAESDAFLVTFLKEKINLPPDKYGVILNEFREYREQQRAKAQQQKENRE